MHGGAGARRAVQREVTAEGLDPVSEPEQAGAAGGVGAAAAVVVDPDSQCSGVGCDLDVDGGGSALHSL